MSNSEIMFSKDALDECAQRLHRVGVRLGEVAGKLGGLSIGVRAGGGKSLRGSFFCGSVVSVHLAHSTVSPTVRSYAAVLREYGAIVSRLSDNVRRTTSLMAQEESRIAAIFGDPTLLQTGANIGRGFGGFGSGSGGGGGNAWFAGGVISASLGIFRDVVSNVTSTPKDFIDSAGDALEYFTKYHRVADANVPLSGVFKAYSHVKRGLNVAKDVAEAIEAGKSGEEVFGVGAASITVEAAKYAAKKVGEAVGKKVGMQAGIQIGMAVGSIFPGVGTAIGAVVGGAIGYAFGSWAGGELAGKAVDAIVETKWGGKTVKEHLGSMFTGIARSVTQTGLVVARWAGGGGGGGSAW